ncbi:MAG: DNA-directed RNA polymerase subunit beta, partial [Mycoplasmataceae bacterium]|nr:DNA-directed RNA polymerase subunit beta [Mycoplasmataceae bacterium]
MSDKKYKLGKFGPETKRRDYSKTVNNLPVLDLVEVQKKSFKWFLESSLVETFKNVYPIESKNGRIRIEFLPKTLRIEKPANEFENVKLCKQKSMSHNVKIYGTLRKIDEETAEVKDSEVLFGEIPLMTSGGTFIINGSEKVIVSQLLRSPGAYYGLNVRTSKSSDGELFNRLELFPKMGLWIDIYHRVTGASTDFVKVSIDKNKAVSISTFLRALGMTKETIVDLFGNLPTIQASLKKDNKATEEEALELMHSILRKGDRITAESKKNLFSNLMFNKRRYNLSRTGRYMLNRKLNLVERLADTVLAEDLKTTDGNVLYKSGTVVDFELAKDIQNQFDSKVLKTKFVPDISYELYANALELNPKLKRRNKMIVVKVNKTMKDYEEKIQATKIIGSDPSAKEEHLLISDIIAAVSYYFNLSQGFGMDDDPDSLVNKRVVSVGELLQNQFQIGLTKIERNAKERMSAREPEKVTPKNITNNKAVFNQFKAFFNSSQLSQFMDQMNPLAEIANKRRITSLGPGGLNRETASFEVRDVHTSHYGRICPIESPEGPNIGLILNFANYSRVNELGFIETPYFKIEKGLVNPTPVYLTAFQEKGFTFGQSSVSLDAKGKITDKTVTVRKDSEYIIVKGSEVDYIDVSSKQMTSIASSCIPFLENDDANRALMGANMQRQAVPLLEAEAPLVGTGVEADIAKWSAGNIRTTIDGEVIYVDSEIIKIKGKSKTKTFQMRIMERSNQGSVITQKPLVKLGDKVKKNQIITDGSSFDKGELAIGKNVVVAFSTWNGYNYEDAVIMSERLVKDDVYTSIHIEEKTIQFRKSKAGDDELTTEIPNVSNASKRHLDETGIVRIGSEVLPGDILVGRVSPKGEDNPTPEEKLIAAIFSRRSKNNKDTSLKVKHGHSGTVIDVQVLSRENGDKLQDNLEMIIRVFVAQKRKIKPGDKMAGRHGNKGVISTILPEEDMPHLADGTPV